MTFVAIDQWGLWPNVGAFAVATALVWIAGTRLVLYGDEMAERFRLGHAFVGLLVLAAITSLPEVVTTLTAAGSGNAALAMGNLYGGVTMQTAILAVADILFVHRALTSWPRKPTHALEAIVLIIFLNVVLIISMLGEITLFLWVGLGSFVLCLAYPSAIALLHRYDSRATWAPIDLPEETPPSAVVTSRKGLPDLSDRALIGRIVVASLIILLAGYATADRADVIARQSGLGSSFVGIALLAAATSTPEISTTFAAARIGAYTMAISNIFGSNMIMVALILPADIAYRSGPILQEFTQVELLSLAAGILVTAIYVAGLLLRRTPHFFGAGTDSIAVLAIYFGSLVAIYRLTQAS